MACFVKDSLALPPAFLHSYGVAGYSSWLIMSAGIAHLNTLDFGLQTYVVNRLGMLFHTGRLAEFRCVQSIGLRLVLGITLFAAITLILLLFLPIAIGAKVIYPWMHEPNARADHALQAKYPLFTMPGFYVVAAGCFLIWYVLSRRLRYWSLQQDQTGAAEPTYHMRFLSGLGIFLFALTLTMAVSNYATGELLDRFRIPPRLVTIGIGVFFLLPGIAWFLTRKWWDGEQEAQSEEPTLDEMRSELSSMRASVE